MSYLLKDIYSPAFYDRLGTVLAQLLPGFNKKQFIQLIFDGDWKHRELKSRMHHTAFVLHQFMELVTTFTSCEFAVRRFIVKYGDTMLQKMLQWSLHKNEHVRRLASEGSRPRLPWAIALPNFKKDPSEYVRRSVANSIIKKYLK